MRGWDNRCHMYMWDFFSWGYSWKKIRDFFITKKLLTSYYSGQASESIAHFNVQPEPGKSGWGGAEAELRD